MKNTMIDYENLRQLNQPYWSEYQNKFQEILESGWFILGNSLKQFETEFADFIGAKHCLGVASGLDALELALKALDLPEKSEIIVPSNTYIATILAIINNGHIPVLVEPDISTYNINPHLIEQNITKKTKAILIVHLYGKSCDMEPIQDICKKYNLYLIEDCAQSHGAKYKGQTTGTFSDLAAFSFYPTKNLGCLGDGGAITTNNKDLYDKVFKLRNYGSSIKYYNDLAGTNSRLDEIQAAFLSIKLKHLNEITEHKRNLAKIYKENLSEKFQLPVFDNDYDDVFHIFNVLFEKRDKLKSYLFDNGVKTEIHYPVPPHQQKALNEFNHLQYPISEKIHCSTLSLPISTIHSEKDIYKVIEIMNKF